MSRKVDRTGKVYGCIAILGPSERAWICLCTNCNRKSVKSTDYVRRIRTSKPRHCAECMPPTIPPHLRVAVSSGLDCGGREWCADVGEYRSTRIGLLQQAFYMGCMNG